MNSRIEEMKKRFLAVVMLSVLFLVSAQTEAAPRYWEQYLRTIAEKYNRLDLIPRYSARATKRYSNSIRYSLPRKRASKKFLRNSVSNPSSSRNMVSSRYSKISKPALNAVIRPRIFSKNVSKITSDPIDIFEISFSNKNPKTSTRFYEPLYVHELDFSLLDNSGMTENLQNFSLSVNGEDFRFDSKGKVTLKFGNLRLPTGAKSSLVIALKVDDPQNVSHRSGSMRLRLSGATGRTESAGNVFSMGVSGTRISQLLVFDPVPKSFGTPVFLGNFNTDIYGKMLTAGDSEVVLVSGFRANYDDILIDQLTLHDTIGSNGVDIFIRSIEAIDLDSGMSLGKTRFINGRAKFTFSNRIFVSRAKEKKIAFRVELENRIPPTYLNTEFRLNIVPADVRAQSYSNGNYIADSNKFFSIENETFTVVDTMLRVVSPQKQTQDLIIGAGHQSVHEVSLTVNGKRDAELGRISFQISANNLAFPGGISVDDFELVRIIGNQQRSLDTTANLSGSVIRFDLNRPLGIYEGNSVKLALKIDLENKATLNDSDGIVVKTMGDTMLQSGTLSDIRATNANFIWSDTSASPHSALTQDWSNGYLLPGIPSVSISYKRDW